MHCTFGRPHLINTMLVGGNYQFVLPPFEKSCSVLYTAINIIVVLLGLYSMQSTKPQHISPYSIEPRYTLPNSVQPPPYYYMYCGMWWGFMEYGGVYDGGVIWTYWIWWGIREYRRIGLLPNVTDSNNNNNCYIFPGRESNFYFERLLKHNMIMCMCPRLCTPGVLGAVRLFWFTRNKGVILTPSVW